MAFKRSYWIVTTEAMGKKFEIVGTNLMATITEVDMLLEMVRVELQSQWSPLGKAKLTLSKTEVEKHVNATTGRTQQWKPI